MIRNLLAAGVMSAMLAPVFASAPEHSLWQLTFSDEFEGAALDREKWDVESGSPTHILSSRWPENIEVGGGVCRLITKKENRGGKAWTTAHLWSKTFRQKYGYFEARYRYGATPGLNNAFWLMTRGGDPRAHKFEIDINEGHYPRTMNMNLHNWTGEHWSRHSVWESPDELTKEFHVYGLEWNERELIWYVDGVVRRVLRHDICHGEVPVILSTAVLKWAGAITNALDGTSMDVDYVRVYKRMGPNPAAVKTAERRNSHPPTGYVLRWADDFDGGKLDETKWAYRTGVRLESAQRPENVSISGGDAVITMKKEAFEGKDFTSGGLISKRKFRYGYYEGRAKMYGRAGWHQSVWSMNASPGGQAHGTEIDGMEFDSDITTEGHIGVIHWRQDGGGKTQHLTCTPGVYRRPLGFDATTDYHAYGFEWTEKDVRVYLDGKLRCVLNYPATEYRHDLVNFWLTSVAHVALSGKVDESGLPGRMFIDHAYVYEKDVYIDDGEEGYREEGAWSDAGKKGFSFSSARQSCSGASSAVWQPEILADGDYQVSLYRVAPPGGAGEAKVDITSAGGTVTKPVKFAAEAPGWVDLGRYAFKAGSAGKLALTRQSGCVAADMVKFVRVK